MHWRWLFDIHSYFLSLLFYFYLLFNSFSKEELRKLQRIGSASEVFFIRFLIYQVCRNNPPRDLSCAGVFHLVLVFSVLFSISISIIFSIILGSS